MTEYGIFNDEGCIDRGHYNEGIAEAAAQYFRDEGDVYAECAEMCPDHDEQRADACEHCNGEDEDG